jgi:putative two-component system response regulator
MTILIAEDNAFYRHALQATLQEWGYEVLAVADGIRALEVLQGPDAPKLAILDWMMPGLEGVEVCRRVRALPRAEPTYLIILTSRTGKENIVAALESGADDYVCKPFDREELRARLKVGLRIVGLQTSQTVVFTFARAVEAKNPYTYGHSDRVTAYALLLADRLGVGAAERDVLQRGALLHDLGKIGIPDAILNKDGALDEGEFHVIKQHPVQGVRMVEGFHSLRDTIPLIRWHHERLDGRGYPDGLPGAEIPPLVRILSVADVYDALASERPYRRALTPATCAQELRHNAAGGGLDPELVECFCRDLPEPIATPPLRVSTWDLVLPEPPSVALPFQVGSA